MNLAETSVVKSRLSVPYGANFLSIGRNTGCVFDAIQISCDDAYEANGSACSLSSGLHLFRQLLANKLFLLLFVRTVEHQTDFGTVMKVHFASLLSIVLHSRMDYFTEYDVY